MGAVALNHAVAYLYLTFLSLSQGKLGLMWVFGITDVMYNLIFRIRFTRSIWQIVNIVTITITVIPIAVIMKVDYPSLEKTGQEK